MISPDSQIKELSAKVHALTELLEVSEQSFIDGAIRLEETNAKLSFLNEDLIAEVVERKKAEDTSRQGERFLSSVFSAIQDGISVVDPGMNIVRVNTIMERWFPGTLPLIGKKCHDAYHARSQPCETCPVRKTLETGEPAWSLIPLSELEGKETIWLEVYSFPIIDEVTREITGVVEYFRDITDRKLAEEKLAAAYDELKRMHVQLLQSEKMASIGQLAAGVAHEINNPTSFVLSNLTSLKRYSTRLLEFIAAQSEALLKISASGEQDVKAILGDVAQQRENSEIDRIIDDIDSLIDESIDGGLRVKKIVQNLKNFSRIDEAEVKPGDINAVIENTLSVIWNELKYKTTVVKDYGEIPHTLANLGQLSQVFMNILINAAQAIEKQGQITIKTRCEENNIVISISDTGQGIPKDILGRIFDPFFTTKEVGKGTGLGLSIAYDIIQKHKGQLNVESRPGEGTTFTITIPVVA